MITRRLAFLAAAAGLVVLGNRPVAAQSITISPLVGVYTQANSLDQLRAAADTISIKRESALALGLNLELGFLRGTLNYVSGANIKAKGGLSGEGKIGEGKILMGAVDAVIRPIPRIVVFQPYAVAGIGFKNFDYDIDNLSIGEVKNSSTAAFHAGLGADFMFGPVGVVAEITDYISQGEENAAGDKELQHDAYGLIGLRFRLF